MELLTVAEVSARLKVHRATLYKMISAGTFPAPFHISPQAPRWRASTVDEWLAALEVAA